MEWKLEEVAVPVPDVDRAKRFYSERVGFVVDVDHRPNEKFRVVQMTPPGSACSITIGTGLPSMPPGLLKACSSSAHDIEQPPTPSWSSAASRSARSSTSKTVSRLTDAAKPGTRSSSLAIPTATPGRSRRRALATDASQAPPRRARRGPRGGGTLWRPDARVASPLGRGQAVSSSGAGRCEMRVRGRDCGRKRERGQGIGAERDGESGRVTAPDVGAITRFVRVGEGARDIMGGGRIAGAARGDLRAEHDEQRVREEEDEDDQREASDGAELVGVEHRAGVEREDQQIICARMAPASAPGQAAHAETRPGVTSV